MLAALALGVSFALAINDVMQAIFNAVSLLFVLAPLYTGLGFGLLERSHRADRMVSISIIVSIVAYVVMFLRDDFANLIMFTVPAFLSLAMLAVITVIVHVKERQIG